MNLGRAIMGRHIMLVLLLIAACLTFLTGCGDNAFSVFSNEDTEEACIHEVSSDLDQGKYPEVLESTCANHMDRGAAYFGLAGYGLMDVAEKIIDASDATTDEDAFNVYMSNLIVGSSKSTFSNIDNAKSEYLKVSAESEHYKDAQFYIDELIGPVKGMTVIKGLLDPDGDGTISDCDVNGNITIDEADAVSCAELIASGSANCNALGTGINSVKTSTNIQFSSSANIYTGLTVTINGTNTTPVCSSPKGYKKLIYEAHDPDVHVATTSEQCADLNGSGTWPCPYEVNGQPVSVVAVINETLVDTDVLDEDLYTEICGTDGACDSNDISNYIQQTN
jgi:hypothetical protein